MKAPNDDKLPREVKDILPTRYINRKNEVSYILNTPKREAMLQYKVPTINLDNVFGPTITKSLF